MEQAIKKRRIQIFLMKNEKFLAYAGWTIFAIVGLLQMNKVRGGFLTNYGADIIAPIRLYYSSRVNKSLLSKLFRNGLNEKQTFVLIFFLCTAWEVMQSSDLSGTVLFITKGYFDILDIIAYFFTLLVCLYFDITRVNKGYNKERIKTY